ncbi:TIGR00645 family protein [Pseudomarimonas arenosa]|uniref:UPF0114 protein IFO71_10875 n=1 Tax=Pseudomarimonas arenosa TaxID=2774145 RepID=A0AAW3ZM41_9GAMM|nr:TIGR00645 family protein [Pseudomarimonas arenosa]MBD8526239.1 TIGR00645 family protein [Pseudomarimonas arenosa]
MSLQTQDNARRGILADLIFGSRWMQLPLYLGLILAQAVYVVLFVKELWHLITDGLALGEQQIMLIVLGLIDVVMISNLLVMVIVGGYETFVSRLRLQGHPDQPEWLSHVNAGVLKVKLATAIIGISSIHLLKTFIAAGSIGALPVCGSLEAYQATAAIHEIMRAADAAANLANVKAACSHLSEAGVLWQTIIHSAFILSALGIAWTDRVMHQSGNGKAKAQAAH